MAETFPGEYERYRQRVPLLIAGLGWPTGQRRCWLSWSWPPTCRPLPVVFGVVPYAAVSVRLVGKMSAVLPIRQETGAEREQESV